MDQVNNKLLKLFSLTSVITLIIAVVAIGWLYKTYAVNLLEEQSAKTNIILSKIIHNSIHIGIETKLDISNLFNDETLQFIANEKNHEFLDSIIHDSIEQTPVVKVKIYSPKLKVIYSTVQENIGKTMDESNIRKVLNSGKSYTEINNYDEFPIKNKSLNNVKLLTTYIPMRIPHEMLSTDENEYGLFGIYVDVTERYQSIIKSQWSFVSVITMVLLIIYATLYLEVRRINVITSKKQNDLDNELRKAEKTNLVLGKNFAKVATKRDRAVKENEAKSQFLANMSHELRTPLNAIIGYSEMILDDMQDGETTRIEEDSGRINSAGKHLLIIINDILDISKIEAGKMELNIERFSVIDMVNEVADTSQPLADKNNNKLILNLNNSIEIIQSDLTRTRQILLNLISNAIKFTQNGEISITVTDVIIDDIESVEFVIQDTGIGLDEKYINKIFSPFNQADLSSSKKYEGTGLGLTISKLICELMNGNISVKSTLGEGSTFTVTIPVKQDKDRTELLTENSEQYNEYCANVLIIDEDPIARKMLSAYLTELNFYVITASTGLNGLRVAENDNIDIIILDAHLSGMDVFSVLSTIKNNNKMVDIKVVLSTSDDSKEMSNLVDVDANISKPYNKADVEEILWNLVGGGESVVSVQ